MAVLVNWYSKSNGQYAEEVVTFVKSIVWTCSVNAASMVCERLSLVLKCFTNEGV